jgi:hypothetical protein
LTQCHEFRHVRPLRPVPAAFLKETRPAGVSVPRAAAGCHGDCR